MDNLLQIFILLPLLGFLVSLFIPEKKESVLSIWSFSIVGLHAFAALAFIVFWGFQGFPTLNLKEIVIYKTDDYEFFIDFYFDKITAVYLWVGSFLTFLVTLYSRYYLHREEGYKRFFNTILFFYLGYNIIIFSGNLETLFLGWEILGISSFLLIAFYRDRYLPVKNALKVFSIYRIGDIGLLLAMWMSHHLWHENITFLKLNNAILVHEHLETHSWIGVFISVMILISAAAKSAQLPFSSWLPRAMEGPTPSSAIFYGSLSVHIGIFVLLRTFPFWEEQISVRILIGLLGLATSFVAVGIARVQSSIKSQIAYASIAQIGLIFVELAAGFETLALIHFAGNAFLRTYQLLVSPSVVSYLIRDQFYNFTPREHTIEDSLPKKIEYSIYLLSLKEWNLDGFMYKTFWSPIKWLGLKLDFLNIEKALYIFIPSYGVGLLCVYHKEWISPEIMHYLPTFFALIGLVMILKSFVERKSVVLSWVLVIMSHFWIALAIAFNENFSFDDIHLYLSGVAGAGLAGYLLLRYLAKKEESINLDRFHGHAYEHPRLALAFLLCGLGLMGFPISPTFIGEDLVFTHIHENQWMLTFFISLIFVIDGLSVIRIFARVFYGPHVKSYHEVAYRAS